MEHLAQFFYDSRHYITTFGVITLAFFSILLLLLKWKTKETRRINRKEPPTVSKPFTREPQLFKDHNDLQAIAGEDLMATQLDLARAYIEMNEKKIAKTILDHVKQKGNPSQQQEASRLMLSL